MTLLVEDVGAGRAGVARDENNEHQWPGSSQLVRPSQSVRSIVALYSNMQNWVPDFGARADFVLA